LLVQRFKKSGMKTAVTVLYFVDMSVSEEYRLCERLKYIWKDMRHIEPSRNPVKSIFFRQGQAV